MSELDVHRLDELASRLDAVVAELDDIALEVLREASADNAGERPVLDKRLTQARRATERASHLVRTISRG
ncbi:hypothetical protein BH23ACT3_BH23ACT3_09310 [soil metagenome]